MNAAPSSQMTASPPAPPPPRAQRQADEQPEKDDCTEEEPLLCSERGGGVIVAAADSCSSSSSSSSQLPSADEQPLGPSSAPVPEPFANICTTTTSSASHHQLAPFNPTNTQVFSRILEILNLSGGKKCDGPDGSDYYYGDVFVDLGCGDGRCLVAAAQQVPGLRCLGVESDPKFVGRAHETLEKLALDIHNNNNSDDNNNVDDLKRRIDIRQGDLVEWLTIATETTTAAGKEETSGDGDVCTGTEASVSAMAAPESCSPFPTTTSSQASSLTLMDATAIYIFLLPKGLAQIKPLLEKLVEQKKSRQQELRICTYIFQIHGWQPSLIDRNTKSGSAIYLYHFRC